MKSPLRPRLIGILLVLVLAVSTAALGFAHRMPSENDRAVAALAAAGIDISDFCGDEFDGAKPIHCPACHLVAGAILPDPMPEMRDAELRLVAEVAAPRESRAIRMVLDPVRGLRGPPIV